MMFPKKIKPFAVPAVLFVLLLISILLLANSLIQRPSVQNLFIKRLTEITGFDIRTRKIELDLWRGVGILVHGFEARQPEGTRRIVAERGRIILDAGDLIKGRIRPVSLSVFQPKIEMALGDRYSRSQTAKKPEDIELPLFWIPGIQSIFVERGQVKIIDRLFDIEELYLEARQESSAPLLLKLSAKGKIKFKGRKGAFTLKGTVLPHLEEDAPPSVDMMLEMDNAPLSWIPWPTSMPVKDGVINARVKVQGSPGTHISASGKIIIKPLNISIIHSDRHKELVLQDATLDFRSVIKGAKLHIPYMLLKGPDLALKAKLQLDLKDRSDPYLDLSVASEFMAFDTFKSLFPSPILNPWVENRLFPILKTGDVRLKLLALKGSLGQFRNLELPENRDALSMRFQCKNFEVSGNGIQLPFKGVSADVVLENGDLLVSGLKARFGSSIIDEAALHVTDIFRKRPLYDVLMDGKVDLQELMRQRDMELIPSDVRRSLNQVGPLTGSMVFRASFGYENGWEFPRILDGRFYFKDCLLKQSGLFFPLKIIDAEISINEKNENPFKGSGTWGDSRFKIFGAFRIKGKSINIQRADIVADVEMNQVIPVFYKREGFPLTFQRPLNWQLSATRERDRWSFLGSIKMEGVAFESERFSLNSTGSRDSLVFDLSIKPGERIVLNRSLVKLGDSFIEISGSHNLNNREYFDLNISSPGFALENIGIHSKKAVIRVGGNVMGSLIMKIPRRNPMDTHVIGQMEGQGLFIDHERSLSSFRESSFRLDMSGKQVTIYSWKMMLGQSPVSIRGVLKGWDGLKGELTVKSDYLNVSDFFPPKKSSHPGDRRIGIVSISKDMDIDLKLDILKGQWRKLEWKSLQADLGFVKGNLYIRSSEVDMENGTLSVKGRVKTGKDPEMFFTSQIRLTDQPIQELLGGILLDFKKLKGSLTMEAKLSMAGKEKKDLIPGLSGSAHISIKNGLIKKSRILFKVLDLLSLQKIFKQRPPDLEKEGFYFESINSDVLIEKGILRSENFVMKSPVFNAVAYGEMDIPGKRVDFILGTQPHGTIDTIASKIPILGYILTGKDGSVINYFFEVKGPISKPETVFITDKTFDKTVVGFFKRLILTPVKVLKDLNKISKDPKKDGNSKGNQNSSGRDRVLEKQ